MCWWWWFINILYIQTYYVHWCWICILFIIMCFVYTMWLIIVVNIHINNIIYSIYRRIYIDWPTSKALLKILDVWHPRKETTLSLNSLNVKCWDSQIRSESIASTTWPIIIFLSKPPFQVYRHSQSFWSIFATFTPWLIVWLVVSPL